MQSLSYQYEPPQNKPYAMIPLSWSIVNQSQVVQSWFPSMINHQYAVAWFGTDMHDIMKRAHISHDIITHIWYRETYHSIIVYVLCNDCPFPFRGNQFRKIYWFDIGRYPPDIKNHKILISPYETTCWGEFVKFTWKRYIGARIIATNTIRKIRDYRNILFRTAVLFVIYYETTNTYTSTS